MICCSSTLSRSRSASSVSSSALPSTERSVVCAICEVASRKFSTSVDRLVRVDDAEVGDRVHANGHVVARDHLLRRDVQRDRAQVDPDHLVDERDQQDQARALLRDQPAEAEDHPALVLAQDPDRRGEDDQDEDRDDGDHGDCDCHERAPSSVPATTSAGGRTRQRQPVDRLDLHSSPSLAHPVGLVVGDLVGEAGAPERPVDEHLAHRRQRDTDVADGTDHLLAPRLRRRPAGLDRLADHEREPATEQDGDRRSPPVPRPRTNSNRCRTAADPTTASATTPITPTIPWRVEMGLGDDQADADHQQQRSRPRSPGAGRCRRRRAGTRPRPGSRG